jgi:predicted deacetylase
VHVLAELSVPRLLVSLSGLTDESPESMARGAEFTAEMAGRGVPLSQLLRPRSGGGPLREGSPLVRWMRERLLGGDAIVLHGYDHTADPIGAWHSSTIARVGRRAEFADLPRHEAGLRLTAARRTLTAVGLRTDLFVPPRWLASAGTIQALREQGFGLLADENGVRYLRDPDMPVVRARVLGFRASGERHPLGDDRKAAEAWRCRVLAVEVSRTARRGGLIRINVRAKDLKRAQRHEAVLAAIDSALELGAVPATYRTTEAPAAA